jgi:hypothetical protein
MLRGEKVWRVDYREGARRCRRYFKNRQDALNEYERLKAQRATAGEIWLSFPPGKRNDIIAVVSEIEAAGFSLRHVWTTFLKEPESEIKAPGLEAAIAELIQSKLKAERRRAYVSMLESILNGFAKGRESLPVSKVTTESISEWLDQAKSPGYRQTLRSRLRTLFSYCQRRKWIRDNPVLGVESVSLDQRPPKILTVDEARTLMEKAQGHPDVLSWIVIGLFCGLRPEEADRTPWAAIDLDRGTIRIDAAASKVRQRRIVHLMPAAIEWLKVAKDGEQPIDKDARTKRLRALRDQLGWEEWPKNVLRHTCASYWLAHLQDAGRTAKELGNSASILLRHYHELVEKDQATAFWAIMPKRHGADKPTAR